MLFAPKTKILGVITYSLSNLPRTLAQWNRKPKKNDSPYLVVRPTLNEYSKILNFMWHYYFPEEPTIMSLGLGHRYNPVFDDAVFKSLSQQISLIAKCKYAGDIVATCVNRTSCPWDPDEMERFSKTIACPRTKELLSFYAHLQRAPSLWEKYETRQVFEVFSLAVSKQERGKGVGLTLLEASKVLAANCGYKVFRVNATSHYASKICEKMNMQLVFEVPYETYPSSHTPYNPLFKPAPPHTSCKVYIDLPLNVKSDDINKHNEKHIKMVYFHDELKITDTKWEQIKDLEKQSLATHEECISAAIWLERDTLLFEKPYTITKSSSKIVIVGLKPFNDYKITFRFVDRILLTVLDVPFDIFRTFISKLPHIIHNVEVGVRNQICKFDNLCLYLNKNCLVKMVAFDEDYMLLIKGTLEHFLGISQVVLNYAKTLRELTENCAPNIDLFLLDVAMESYNRNVLQNIAHDIVKSKCSMDVIRIDKSLFKII